VWVSGSELTRRDGEDLDNVIQRAVVDQYGNDFVERFSQLEPAKKAIVIDDFHRVKVNMNRRGQMIEHLTAAFGAAILLVWTRNSSLMRR
jgi:hypothetical protein